MLTKILLLLLATVVCLNAVEFSGEEPTEIAPPEGAIFCKDTMEHTNPSQDKTDLKGTWEEVKVRPPAPVDKQTQPK